MECIACKKELEKCSHCNNEVCQNIKCQIASYHQFVYDEGDIVMLAMYCADESYTYGKKGG